MDGDHHGFMCHSFGGDMIYCVGNGVNYKQASIK